MKRPLTSRHNLMTVTALLVLLIVCIQPVPASVRLSPEDPICSSQGVERQRARPDARIRELTIFGDQVSVLLPPAYQTSRRRYPLLYLLHGGTDSQDHFLTQTDLLSFTRGLPDSQQMIVVTPFAGLSGFYVDWKDGSHRYESVHINQVLPAIDRLFRTKSDKAHRAVAGASMGGWGATHYAMRHPSLFSVVGSFSGGDDNQAPDATAIFLLATMLQRHCGDALPIGGYDPFGMFGNPATDAARWQAANPTAHPNAFKGMHVYLTSGNGAPCNQADAAAVVASPTSSAVEIVAAHATLDLHQALTAAGIPHIYRLRRCGLHITPYFNQDLREFLPLVARWLANGR